MKENMAWNYLTPRLNEKISSFAKTVETTKKGRRFGLAVKSQSIAHPLLKKSINSHSYKNGTSQQTDCSDGAASTD